MRGSVKILQMRKCVPTSINENKLEFVASCVEGLFMTLWFLYGAFYFLLNFKEYGLHYWTAVEELQMNLGTDYSCPIRIGVPVLILTYFWSAAATFCVFIIWCLICTSSLHPHSHIAIHSHAARRRHQRYHRQPRRHNRRRLQ